ncbi:MAG: ribonuclease HIII [Erysipelotrichaceae bacterium]|nr:ribonuclease HIII [Erysipelotrichaceae bacterium]
MATITLTLTDQQIDQLKNTWSDSLVKAPAYARYQLRVENCVITAYESRKVVFQGKDAEIYASPFQKVTDSFHQAGSDEVGTGDYFGPVCVCACVITPESWKMIEHYCVNDSKQITDEQILKTVPELMKYLDYSLLILEPEKYNQIQPYNNLNQIKAKLHNQAYLNLIRKQVQLPELKVIDQFTPPHLYYRYLSTEPHVITGLHFETKAESKYPAVACASMIARYAFLKTWEKMEQDYQMTFHKGSGAQADKSAKEFVEKYGFDALKKTAKLHFKNTEKIK